MRNDRQYREALADIRSAYSVDRMRKEFHARDKKLATILRDLAVLARPGMAGASPLEQEWLGFELAKDSRVLKFYAWYRE